MLAQRTTKVAAGSTASHVARQAACQPEHVAHQAAEVVVGVAAECEVAILTQSGDQILAESPDAVTPGALAPARNQTPPSGIRGRSSARSPRCWRKGGPDCARWARRR